MIRLLQSQYLVENHSKGVYIGTERVSLYDSAMDQIYQTCGSYRSSDETLVLSECITSGAITKGDPMHVNASALVKFFAVSKSPITSLKPNKSDSEIQSEGSINIPLNFFRRGTIYHKYVLRLQIPMNDVARVQELKTTSDIQHSSCYKRRLKRFRSLTNQVFQVSYPFYY